MPLAHRFAELAAAWCGLVLLGCSSTKTPDSAASEAGAPDAPGAAPRVTSVAVTGSPGAYRFDVTLSTQDTGCSHYANWWEVTTLSEQLVYRRILAHSHVDEQPFSRSGGPIDVGPKDGIVVRLHMNDTGYATAAMQGSAAAGLTPTTLDSGFGEKLKSHDPQPNGCAF